MNKLRELNLAQMKSFAERYSDVGILSTDAEATLYSGVLYNVDGSRDDPNKVPGYENASWMSILEGKLGLTPENSQCFVTNQPAPAGKSHPEFLVGGHMTPNKDGLVEKGADSYLMPLCKWHNHPKRNHKAFEYDNSKKIVRLSGYMLSDLAVTFAARFDSEEPYALVYFDTADQIWKTINLTKHQALDSKLESNIENNTTLEAYILMERSDSRKQSEYFIKEVNLPDV